MKKLILLLLLVSNFCAAQDFSDSWEGLFSFTNIIDIDESDDAVYAASENAVFIYDLSSRTFTTLTTVNGLSGDEISQIHYSEAKSTLIIGYENGLLQVVDARGNVTSVVAIQDKQVIAPDDKRINEFKESGDLIYIATDFGIAIYNLERLEFDDTYFIGDNGAQLEVNTIELFNNFLYAGTTNGGIRRASIVNPFLIDFAIVRIDYENVKTLNSFKLFGLSHTRNLKKGTLIYSKNEAEKYTLKYAEVEEGSQFGVKRPLTIIEKNKHVKGRRKQNELDTDIHFIMTIKQKSELVVFENEQIPEASFTNFKENPSIKPVYLPK